MSLEAGHKAPLRPGRLDPVKVQQDPKRLVLKKSSDMKPQGANKQKEHSPEASPKAAGKQNSGKAFQGSEASTHSRQDRLSKIKEVIKEFSGSLERQNHPLSQFDEEQRNRSYLPRRFDAREMNIKIPNAKQKIRENESYLQQLDNQIAGLEKETATKVKNASKR